MLVDAETMLHSIMVALQFYLHGFVGYNLRDKWHAKPNGHVSYIDASHPLQFIQV